MARKKLKVGLIGCGGNMTGAHLPRIQRDGAVEIVGVADPVREAAARLMQRAGGEVPIPYYEDWRKLVLDPQLDAVLVILPRHARALLELAAKKRRILVVAYQRHWMAPYVHARELIRKGAIGEIRGVVAYVTQRWGGARGWRLDPELSGGGMFMDTGSHLVASTLWVTGLEPQIVSATIDNVGRKVDTNAVVSLKFKGGALGTLNSFGNAARHDERLAISGSEGSLVLHLHQWRVKSFLLNDEPVEIPSRVESGTPDQAFFNWIRNGGKGYPKQDFALQVSRLTEAAYRSAERREPVKVRL